jgi:Domain of unknown function (DUF374)
MALESAWDDALPGVPNPFKQSYFGLWEAVGSAPALLANTTQVENGMRVVVAPFMSVDGPLEAGTLHQRTRRTVYVGTKLLDEGWETLKPSEEISRWSCAGMTSRFTMEPAGPHRLYKREQPLAMWHGQHFMLPFLRRGFPFKVLISRHIDGEINAIAAEWLGVSTVRVAAFIYRCRNTGLRIQALAAEKITEGEDTCQPVTCIMCRQVHLVNPFTGKDLGEDNE